MNRKLFAVTVMACLAGLGAIATQSRQQVNSAADKTPVAPTVETTVVQRTKYVHRRVHHARRHASSAGASSRAGSGGGNSATTGETQSAPVVDRQVATVPATPAPRPTTSPSATGGQGGENETEHEIEQHDDGGESEREDD